MANDEHVALLKQGVAAWNAWRDENPDIRPDLSGADLHDRDLRNANLSNACLIDTDLSGALLSHAHFIGAECSSETDLSQARLVYADLSGVNLNRTSLFEANLNRAILKGTQLIEADFSYADLLGADLSGAFLSGARLLGTRLVNADLSGADLKGANLEAATLVGADLTGADLTGSRVYGVSAWRVIGDDTEQQDLIITDVDEPTITLDNIEVAQLIHLMLVNPKISDVINATTSKAVLILGRFDDGRKAVLDALREELRKRDYLPILFDFKPPDMRDLTETISLLAHMARFIIADLTDPSSLPHELEAIVPHLAVPVQPLLDASSRPYGMFKDYTKYPWVLPIYRYEGLEALLATLAEKVICPAEGKVKALQERRRMIEAELTKPQ
jgi:uncharacterized protein YjbI with pentapeptide repeats